MTPVTSKPSEHRECLVKGLEDWVWITSEPQLPSRRVGLAMARSLVRRRCYPEALLVLDALFGKEDDVRQRELRALHTQAKNWILLPYVPQSYRAPPEGRPWADRVRERIMRDERTRLLYTRVSACATCGGH